MRTLALLVVVSFAVLFCPAESAATNVASSVTFAVSTTNAPAAKVSRQQCEAVTKSGNRCKRNAVLGEKLCRQHKKIFRAKEGRRQGGGL